MRHRMSDLAVGIVTLGTIALVTAAVTWVEQADVGDHRQRVVARFTDVGNARVGNAVVLRGVRAGRIEAMELAPDGWVHVRMSLDPGVRLPPAPVVLLNETSLFGEWQATVSERTGLPADVEVRRQVAAAAGARGVLPGATLPDIAKLTAVAGRIAGDVASVAGRVEVAFDDRAAAELRGSIHNVARLAEVLSTTVRAHAGDLDSLSDGLHGAVRSIALAAASSRRLADRLERAAPEQRTAEVMEDVAAAAAELRATSRSLSALSLRLAGTQARVDTVLGTSASVLAKLDRADGSLGLFLNDPSFYRRSDSLLAELHRLAADVRQNPKRYLQVRIF